PACSSASSKTKQKPQPTSSTQVTIKTKLSSSKCKVPDISLPQPPAGKHSQTATKAADKSSNPKGKKRAVNSPSDEKGKDISFLF
ncbi:hypothetical protein Moror_15701, partial [Moniliophthora roreri MCA 2997]